MSHSIASTSLALLLLLSANACQGSPACEAQPVALVEPDLDAVPAEPSEDSSAARLSEAKAMGVMNASVPEPGLLCSGQLTEDQFETLAELGYRTFINLRQPNEDGTGWEAERAQLMNVDYVSIPVAGSADLDEANALLLNAALEAAQGPIVLYCGSSNRVGALYGLRGFYAQGKSPEESLALSQAAGATRLLARVKQLVGLADQN